MEKVNTINQTEVLSSDAADRRQKGIHLRDLKGVVPGPEVPVSVEDMKKSVKGAVNKAFGFEDQGGE